MKIGTSLCLLLIHIPIAIMWHDLGYSLWWLMAIVLIGWIVNWKTIGHKCEP